MGIFDLLLLQIPSVAVFDLNEISTRLKLTVYFS